MLGLHQSSPHDESDEVVVGLVQENIRDSSEFLSGIGRDHSLTEQFRCALRHKGFAVQ